VPEAIAFVTKPEIALAQIEAALRAGVPQGVVLMDAGYGTDTGLHTAITALGLPYVAGIQSTTTLWPADKGPLPPKPWSGRGRPTTRTRRDAEHQPAQAKAIALGLPTSAWQRITWREGSADRLRSRFARLRVRAAHRDERLTEPRSEEWLLIEWPQDEAEPTKYWLSTLPEDIAFDRLVDVTKLRWRIERDYQELKQELGLGHYEGRGWRGFHHHATLCIAAYGFLISQRERIPPSAAGAIAKFQKPAVPTGYRPRGAADPARTAHPQFDCHDATTPHYRARQEPRSMSMLQCAPQAPVMTQ
jgi:SRSO17 transposase